jgi:hypothetical protein
MIELHKDDDLESKVSARVDVVRMIDKGSDAI